MKMRLLQISKRDEFKRKFQILEDYISQPTNVQTVTPKQKQTYFSTKHSSNKINEY
jgi:hypothetical protein